MWYAGWVYVLGAAGLAAVGHGVTCHVIKRRRFAGRKCLSDEDLICLFANQGMSANEVKMFLVDVSRSVGIRLSLLRPDDRFDIELAPIPWLSFDDGIYLLPDVLARRFDVLPEQVSLADAQNLRGLLDRIVALRNVRSA